MSLKGVALLAFVWVNVNLVSGFGGVVDDLELETQLKLINKPPLKTIQTEYGDVVDCIDINKQLAFDHPLLKNHKIQRRPSSRPSKEATSPAVKPSRIGLSSEVCPSGTVPIRRTRKEDLLRMRSVTNAVAVENPSESNPNNHVSYPFYYIMEKLTDRIFHGAKANINAWNPKVSENQSSTAQLWIESGTPDVLNSIQAGWMVSSQLYGDDYTRLTTFWTADGYQKTGCYNALCSGFVQTDKNVFLGAHLLNTSIYDGAQYEIVIHVYQDPKSKNWWLVAEGVIMGYWPAALFTSLTNGAEQVGWGGRASGTANGPSPQMGSGYLPDGNYYHSGSFRQIFYVNQSNALQGPSNEARITYFIDKPSCYDLKFYGFQDEYMGYAFMFGGPGGACGA
ncbi:hypothetical protein L1049_018963 [Liquidambar formosana]|uniref:Neprosin PEP catalytic domain-containing protein n=1 Tax=Liquidambar formosana TaxID=63359 RepID=A0AAP0WMX4_LIQFO